MALSTYSELVTALGVWMKGSPLAGQEEVLVALATDEINARLADALNSGARIRPMLERDIITIDAEYESMPDADSGMILPLAMEVTSLDDAWQIDYIAPEHMVAMKYGEEDARSEVSALISGDPPRYYTIVGSQFRFFPEPQSGDSFTADFSRYVKVPDINDNNTTNWVLTNHRNAYLYGAVAQAEMLGWNDPRMVNVATLFANAVDGITARYPAPADMTPLRSEVALLGSRRGLTNSSFLSGNF